MSVTCCIRGYCKWQLDDPDFDAGGPYVTQCDEYFQFNDGGPKDNGFKFCPFCGAQLQEVLCR